MENLPVFLIMQVLLAQAYPLLASGLGVAWAVGNIATFFSYCQIGYNATYHDAYAPAS